MSNNMRLLFIAMLTVFYGNTCTCADNNSSQYLDKGYTQEELDKILYVGMPKDKVISCFGVPTSIIDIKNESQGNIIYDYLINPATYINKTGLHPTGFTVEINSSGKVAFWGLGFAEIPPSIKSVKLEEESEKQRISDKRQDIPFNYMLELSITDSSYSPETVKSVLLERLQNFGVHHTIEIKSQSLLDVRVTADQETTSDYIKTILTAPARLEFALLSRKNKSLISEYNRDPIGFKCPDNLRMMTAPNPGKAGNSELKKCLYFVNKISELKVSRLESVFCDSYGFAHISLNNKDASVIKQITSENLGRELAIIIDDILYCAPCIMGPIDTGQILVSKTSKYNALRIILTLAKYPLPCQLIVLKEQAILPHQDSGQKDPPPENEPGLDNLH